MADHNIQDVAPLAGEAAAGVQRKPWQAPVFEALMVADAETGVNSTTDAANTFS